MSNTATNITPASTKANTTPANTTPANTTPAKTTPAKNADKKPNVTDQGEDGIGDEIVDNQIIQDLYGKEHINLVFIGHKRTAVAILRHGILKSERNAGKSTMGGNILYLTGMVDQRTMEKYEKEAKEQNRESWYLSWALDTSKEERAKGKTVECGRAYFETEKRRYTILDAPGHKNYVPSMIGGASQADVGIMACDFNVISARKGEFETGFERGGQTREHTVLAKTSGVNKLVIVINKMDDSTVNWSKERYDECVTKLTPFLKSSGYNPTTDIEFMPVSAFTGANLKERVSNEECSGRQDDDFLRWILQKNADKKPNVTDQGEDGIGDEIVDNQIIQDLYGKEHINLVFIGHKRTAVAILRHGILKSERNAGKSTMGGNILYLTGMVDQRTMEKYEKEAKEQNRESWYLSWALDTSKEERAKGKTVECGRAYFETEKRRYTILDAPGHKNYVPSMIGGASQADVGIMACDFNVISARKGEFETGFERGGQTREHTVLAKTSGVNKLVIVINKMDDSTVNWSKERYDECVTKLTPFLKSSGYNPTTDIEFMPVSAFTGANLKERVSNEVCKWYSGPSLLEYLDNMKALDRNLNAPLMMPITEKYKDMGTILVGKVESGTVKKGQSVLVMPNKRTVEVSAVYNEVEDEVIIGACGDNIRLRVRGIEEEEISTGFVVCSIKRPVKTTTMFEAQLAILEHKNIICAGYSAVLHIHSCVEEISIAALLHLIDKKTGRKSKRPPQYVKKGQKVIARLETQGPICVEIFEEYPQLGRFTLRDEGKTIAIGKVTKVIEHE
ncbi:20231_t:CDS:10 [Racocetra persica]|uniref:20231_t:CDS:1 n=1 Tax=Racocetra persica TaxID=160502 RepID=A0ACA9L6D2_9GLOM|nr:20231_t:CDS:10 [Racocetra persica]